MAVSGVQFPLQPLLQYQGVTRSRDKNGTSLRWLELIAGFLFAGFIAGFWGASWAISTLITGSFRPLVVVIGVLIFLIPVSYRLGKGNRVDY